MEMNGPIETPAAEAAPALPVGMAALVTLGLIVVIAGFVAIGIAAGIAPLYAGFLILWYFGSVDNLETKSLPALFVGALAGLGTSWLIQYGAGHWGANWCAAGSHHHHYRHLLPACRLATARHQPRLYALCHRSGRGNFAAP